MHLYEVNKVNVDNKKHVFVFKTVRGDMTVGTDDIFELSGQQWFTGFLGLANSSVVREKKSEVKTYTTDEVKKILAAVREEQEESLRDEIEERARELAMEMISDTRNDLPELPPEEEVKAVAEEMSREMEQQQRHIDAQAKRPNIRRDIPTAGQTSFMDITPDRMTEQMWGSLTDEQRTAYGQKYMPKS